MANKKLIFGAVGCLVFFGLAGVVCTGVGTGAWFYLRHSSGSSEGPSPTESEAGIGQRGRDRQQDFLADAHFLAVDQGLWVAPVAWDAPRRTPDEGSEKAAPGDAEADPEAPEPAAETMTATPRGSTRGSKGSGSSGSKGQSAPAAAEPEPSPSQADDDDPIISDDELKELDAELQEIQRNHAATEATEKKKKKK